jgi:hypothetical protein
MARKNQPQAQFAVCSTDENGNRYIVAQHYTQPEADAEAHEILHRASVNGERRSVWVEDTNNSPETRFTPAGQHCYREGFRYAVRVISQSQS